MSTLEFVVKELKSLPTAKLKQAAGYIAGLKANTQSTRLSALKRTAGSLSAEEARDLETIIEEGCERIDARDW